MLQGNFFHITTLEKNRPTPEHPLSDTVSSVKAWLELNPAHAIFGGHFPGQPVVPGVCMMQMVKEITENVLGRETRLVKADQLKFLVPVIPAAGKSLRMELKLSPRENGETGVDAQLQDETTLFFKFKGAFA